MIAAPSPFEVRQQSARRSAIMRNAADNFARNGDVERFAVQVMKWK